MANRKSQPPSGIGSPRADGRLRRRHLFLLFSPGLRLPVEWSTGKGIIAASKMHIESSGLGFHPSDTALRLFDMCAPELSPDNGELLNWHADFEGKHRVRPAYDLDIAKNNIPP